MFPSLSDVTESLQGDWFWHYSLIINAFFHNTYWSFNKPLGNRFFIGFSSAIFHRFEVHHEILKKIIQYCEKKIDIQAQLEVSKIINQSLIYEHIWLLIEILLILFNLFTLFVFFSSINDGSFPSVKQYFQIWMALISSHTIVWITIFFSRERVRYVLEICDLDETLPEVQQDRKISDEI